MKQRQELYINYEEFVRSDVRELREYVPIEPTELLAERAGLSEDQVAKLDGNENPYGPSPRVLQALASFRGFHIYPDPSHTRLRRALSRYTGLGEEHIIAGSGSDEIIDLILRCLLSPGDGVVDCVPTFGMYSFLTSVCGGTVHTVQRSEGWELDISSIAKAVDERTKVIFVASPNNPTSNLLSQEELEALLALGPLVVVDEAYYEFSGVTFVPLMAERANLAVLRSFSKWAGLAGLRVGYGLLPTWLAASLWKIKQPYNVNSAAMLAAEVALEDAPYRERVVSLLVAERERLFRELSILDFLRPWPSRANFVFCQVARGSAREIKEHLACQGIFVRYFDQPRLRDALRISVGLPQHTDRLVGALKEISREL